MAAPQDRPEGGGSRRLAAKVSISGLGINNKSVSRTKFGFFYKSTPNLKVHTLLHITVDANGVVTSSMDDFSIVCH